MVVVSTQYTEPIEGILHMSPSATLLVNDQEVGSGSLYITEQNVVWSGTSMLGGGQAPMISLLYPTISLHAVQREPSPALYMVLNFELKVPGLQTQGSGDAGEDDDDEDFDGDNQPITQIRIVPHDENDLNAMYSAMNLGQALHPDPADEVHDMDDDDNYMDGEEFDDGEDEFEDAEETNQNPDDPAAKLRQLSLDNSNGHHNHDDGDAGTAGQ